MSEVTIEREMYGDKEHLTLRVGNSGVRVDRSDLETIKHRIAEFEVDHCDTVAACPECGSKDSWQRNNCILNMRCTACDHEETGRNLTYYNEDLLTL